SAEMDVGHHGNDDGSAENDVEGIGTHAGNRETVLQDGQHQRTEEGTDYSAGTAGEQSPADHGGGDAHEHDFIATGERIDRADAKRIQHSGQSTEHAAHDKVADTNAMGLDADLARAGRVTARGNGMQAPAALAQHD